MKLAGRNQEGNKQVNVNHEKIQTSLPGYLEEYKFPVNRVNSALVVQSLTDALFLTQKRGKEKENLYGMIV